MKKLLLHIFLLIFLVGCVKIEDITVEPTPSPTVVENQNEENTGGGQGSHNHPGSFSYQEVIDFLVSVNTKGYIESIEENLDGSITTSLPKKTIFIF